MAKLREETPQEFSDDERWYTVFTTLSLAVVVVCSLFTFFLATLLSRIGLGIVGFILGAIITLVAFMLVSVRVMEDDVIHGSGTLLADILYRMIVRKRVSRIYIKDFDKVDNNDAKRSN